MNVLELKEKVYTFPENIEEVNLDTYERIQVIINNKDEEGKFTYKDIVSILSIITGIEEEVIYNSPIDFFNTLFSLTSFVFDFNIKDYKPQLELTIENELYTYSPDSNISLKEWVDIDTILKEFPEDKKLSGVLAVRLRKPDEKYTSEFLEKRIAIFKQAKIVDVMPVVAFFLTNENKLQQLLKIYFQGLELSHIQQEANDNLLKSGVGMQQSLTWQKKILTDLNLFYKNQLLKCSNFYRSVLINKTT